MTRCYLCGDDQTFDTVANGYTNENHSRTFIDHEINEDNHEMAVGDDVNIVLDDEDLEIEEVGEATPIPAPQPPPSSKLPLVLTPSDSSGRSGQSGRKRKNHHLGDKIEYLASQIGKLAEAIRSSRKCISAELFSEVMKCEAYDEVSLVKAFDYLHERENLARGFLVKNQNLRQAWLSDFSLGDQIL